MRCGAPPANLTVRSVDVHRCDCTDEVIFIRFEKTTESGPIDAFVPQDLLHAMLPMEHWPQLPKELVTGMHLQPIRE